MFEKPFMVRSSVTVQRFKVQRSAPPLTAEAASLIEKETPALRSQIRGLSAASDRRSGQFDQKSDAGLAESHTRVSR